ncbi:charged multivesicular body protein 4b [Elysia marginata]|uniref:Charged multivesicular body protein 4b n=1 Tax=Elysia marginata TaxID=1093978 RepID=A0AAV4F929_9GAST|nr:charged multivesicular body protein 4b [Elysia marginata]
MSFFKRIFRDDKGAAAPTPQEGIQRLREIEEMLNKKSEFLEKKIEAQINIAKNNGMKNKRVALRALKSKRHFEKQLQQIDGSLSTIEYQREALESATANVEVFNVLRVANQALEAVHKQLDTDEVHKIMDEAAEQRELADELSGLLSNPENFGGQIIDEDELLAELEELEQEGLSAELLQVGPSSEELPSVPTTEPNAAIKSSKASKNQQKEEEDEEVMKQLEMWAS